MPQVFISYSRKDIAIVRQLAEDLKKADFNVWWDISGLKGGDAWMRAIQTGLKASQYCIVVLSRDSVESEWVEKEYTYAIGLGLKVIPILYKDCEIPLALANVQYVDFRDDKYDRGLWQLLIALQVPQVAPTAEREIEKLAQEKVVTRAKKGLAKLQVMPLRVGTGWRSTHETRHARDIWARYKTAIGMLAVLLMVAVTSVLGKRIVSILQPAPTPPTPLVSIEAFLITKEENLTVTVEPGTTITATVGGIVQTKVEVSTPDQEQGEDLLFTWYTCKKGNKPVLRGIGSPEMPYVTPSEPGSDCICVVVEKGGVQLDRDKIFVDIQK